jgi:hypothetical protein
VLFFGRAGCVGCHAVSGASNEMFSDFRQHVIGVPQLIPSDTNNTFSGPGANEDFGREDVTGDPTDRYAFRTAPLRNLALSPSFMHDGAFTTLPEAIRHHLDVVASARSYDPVATGLPPDLSHLAPIEPILVRLDPLVTTPRRLADTQVDDLSLSCVMPCTTLEQRRTTYDDSYRAASRAGVRRSGSSSRTETRTSGGAAATGCPSGWAFYTDEGAVQFTHDARSVHCRSRRCCPSRQRASANSERRRLAGRRLL